MPHSVYFEDLHLDLNLSRADLGHPDFPELGALVEQARHDKFRRDRFQCLDTECLCGDGSMYLQGRPGQVLVAVHYNPAEGTHGAPESDEHKALKERVANALRRESALRVEVEARSSDGRVRTDVLISGPSGFNLGFEAQLSRITAGTVQKRTRLARERGITALWTTEDPYAQLIERAPWARIPKETAWRIAAGTDLLVLGGLRTARWERCDDRRAEVCPVTRRGRCGKLHPAFDATTGVHLERMIHAAAFEEYQPLEVPISGGSNCFWVTREDRARYLDSVGGAAPTQKQEEEDEGASEEREIDYTCNYGAAPPPRPPAQRRDTGARIAPAVTVDEIPKPSVVLDWRKNPVGPPRNCRICSYFAITRDEQGRPCHKTCAERESSGVGQ